MIKEQTNTRVLIIDDEELVRDNIEEILVPVKMKENEEVINASNILFDITPPEVLSPASGNIPDFWVDKAVNGMEGVDKVKKAFDEERPYAVIFLDMRMPGWDGLETAMRIRAIDTKAEIVIVTAYSDKSIEDIVAKAGRNVGYHCKPYASEEILQLAIKGVNDYNKLRNLETLINIIASLSISENHLNTLLQNILDQLAMYINTDMAVLGKIHGNKTYEKLFSIGTLEENLDISQVISKIATSNINKEEVTQVDEIVFAKLDDYSVFAILKKGVQLKTEKLYLLRLFVQNAAKAIRNAALNEQLLKNEKLSAVGAAIAMIMHDLRSPIKNIPVITEMIREEGNESELLELLDQCGEQASEIFDDFMDFLNESPIKKERLNVAQLINEGIELSNAESKILLHQVHQSVDESIWILGDASKMKRIFMNLINNAMDVIKDTKLKDGIININAYKKNSEAVIEIKDNGPGIPTEILNTLFDAFVTKQKSNGTGLGLAIVKQFVLAHGGRINVQNDNGAVFSIHIPLTV